MNPISVANLVNYNENAKNPFHFREEKRKENMSPLFWSRQRCQHLVYRVSALHYKKECMEPTTTNVLWTSDATKREQME